MKKKLEKKINLCLSILITIVLLPLLVTIVIQKMQVESLLSGGFPMAAESLEPSEETVLSDRDSQPEYPKTSGEAEEKVVGIVAREIGAQYDKHAIMAQCVIARTNLYAAWKAGAAEPEGLGMDEMKKLWGNDFEKIYGEMKRYAAATAGETLTCNGNYIYAAYHAISSGTTRNMSELYEDSSMPYLQEIPCHEDPMADGYLAVLYWSQEEFLKSCKTFFPESDVVSIDEIKITKRDKADYVLEVTLGGLVCTGEEFRDKFSLNSSCFTLSETKDGQVRIVTKGLGHGFGLSQHTADLLAKEGKNYKEILSFFYPGTEITKVEAEK